MLGRNSTMYYEAQCKGDIGKDDDKVEVDT
jgi:hypothetical protein